MVSSMCKIMEEAMAERAAERAMEIAEKLIASNKMTLEEIAQMTSLPLEKTQELARGKTA